MNAEKSHALADFEELFEQWKCEHHELDTTVQLLVDSVCGRTNVDKKRFSGIAYRLRQILLRLQEHFDKEQRLGKLLAEVRGASTIEIDAVCRRAANEHTFLTDRLERLAERIEQGAFDDWEAAATEFSLFVDAWEQHEERQEESVQWLAPSQETTSNTVSESKP